MRTLLCAALVAGCASRSSTSAPPAAKAPPAPAPVAAAPAPEPAAEPARKAPDFTLTSTEGSQVTLSKLLETGPVILAFFPKAFTGG